jgi:peptidoglycan/xylan/chitin deacetylase (PgdA/CDA1 family)
LLQAVEPDVFAAQLDVVAELAAVVPLSALDEPSRERRVAITFDDGYADNASAAAPILAQSGLPATFFIPSRVLVEPDEYWWDSLEHLLLDGAIRTDTVDVSVAARRVRIDVRSDAGRLRSLKALNRRLRSLPLPLVQETLVDVRAQLRGETAEACAAHAVLDADAVALLAREPLFEIAGHGATHAMLSALTPAEQEVEIAGSRRALEQVTERPVTSFAYPYGTNESFTADTVELVRRRGYERACSNMPGPIRRANRFRLPRHMIYNWQADMFRRTLLGWFNGS